MSHSNTSPQAVSKVESFPVSDKLINTTTANQIANDLINQLYIQSGYGLAPFLNLDEGVNNHKAVRLWVQQRLDSGLIDDFVELAIDEVVHQLANELTGLCSFECSL